MLHIIVHLGSKRHADYPGSRVQTPARYGQARATRPCAGLNMNYHIIKFQTHAGIKCHRSLQVNRELVVLLAARADFPFDFKGAISHLGDQIENRHFGLRRHAFSLEMRMELVDHCTVSHFTTVHIPFENVFFSWNDTEVAVQVSAHVGRIPSVFGAPY